MKEAIEKILELEGKFQQDMEEARRQADAIVAQAKKEAQEMEEVYRRAFDEKKKADQEALLKEIEAYEKKKQQQNEKEINEYQKLFASIRESVKKEIERRLWEE